MSLQREPRLLFIDIEVLPNTGTFWDRYPQGGIIPWENITQERTILCVAWKWQGAARVRSIGSSNGDDYKICQKVLKLWKSADAIAGHCSDKYDLRWLKGRMAIHGLGPPPPVVQIDTKKIAQKHLNLNSYSLGYLAHLAKIGEKIPTEYAMWQRCMSPDPKVRARALKPMIRYCKHDVELLEGVYSWLRAYDQERKLNRALFSSDPDRTCSSCGEQSLIQWGFFSTRAGIQRRLFCKACHSWSRRPMGSGVPR